MPSLIAYLGSVAIADVSVMDLRAWRAHLADSSTRYRGSKRERSGKLSPYTLHQYVRCARRFFAWLHAEGYLENNPAQRLELPPLPRPRRRGIAAADCERILASARAIPQRLRDRAPARRYRLSRGLHYQAPYPRPRP